MAYEYYIIGKLRNGYAFYLSNAGHLPKQQWSMSFGIQLAYRFKTEKDAIETMKGYLGEGDEEHCVFIHKVSFPKEFRLVA